MPARTGHTTYIPGVGSLTTHNGRNTFQGKGPAPAGAKKVRTKTVRRAPIVTVTPTGQIQTQNIPVSHHAAVVAAQRHSQQRVNRIQNHLLRMVNAAAPALSKPKAPTKAQLDAAYSRALDRSGFRKTWDATTPGSLAKLGRIERRVDSRLGVSNEQAAPAAPSPQVKHVTQELKRLRSQASSGPLPFLPTPEQQKIAKTVLRVGQKEGADRKEKLAAIDTGLQETGFKNLRPYENGFGENTAGWREELAPYYTGRRNVKKSARNFFHETKTDPSVPGGGSETPGELAQTVQGSAFGGEETYGTHTPEAVAILKAFNQGKRTPAQQKQIQALEARARKLGINPHPEAHASKQQVTRYKAGLKAAEELAHAHIPYVWGGGHGGFESPTAGLDCSGAVSYVLHRMGVLKSPLTSGSMGSVLAPGPGAVTVFYNPTHTFMSFGGKFFGTSVNNSSKGLAFYKNPGTAYLSQFNVGHVPGLGKKVAASLGLPMVSAGSFPGIELSSNGTTATIEAGAGVINKGAPKFSSSPILPLTPYQLALKGQRRLRNVEAELGPTQARSKGSGKLAELEEKYGKTAV